MALLCLIIIPAFSLTTNNDQWLSDNHPQEIYLDYLNSQFTSGDDLVIAIALEDSFFNHRHFQPLSRLESALKNHLGEDLISIRSPLSATRIADNRGVIEIEDFIGALRRGAYRNLEDYQKDFDQSPYGGRLLSFDHKIVAFDLRLDTRERADKRHIVMDKIDAVLDYEGFNGHFIGEAALKDEMNRQTSSELSRLLILSALVFFAFLFFALGRFWVACFLLLVASLAVMTALSMVSLLGHHMTIIALILPILSAIIVIAHSLHILMRNQIIGQKMAFAEPSSKADETMKHIWRPCFYANLTSAIGFGSFIFSDLIPIQDFSIDAFFTLIMLYILTLLSFWSLFRLGFNFQNQKPQNNQNPENHDTQNNQAQNPQNPDTQNPSTQNHKNNIRKPDLWLHHALTWLHFSSEKYRFWLPPSVLGFALLCGSGLYFFHTETNFLSVFFKDKSQIRQDFNLADNQLGGSGVVDIIIRQKQSDFFKRKSAFDLTHKLAQDLARHPTINYAEAMDIPIGLVHHAFGAKKQFPQNENQLSQELLFLELSRSEAKDDILSPYVNFDYSATHIHLRTPDLKSNDIQNLIFDINAIMAPAHSLGEVIFTGFNVFVDVLGVELVEVLLESLALTSLLILVIFIFIFGFKIGVIGWSANLLPIIIMLGAISWLGFPFDVATILVASITLGLAVDDSIHFLHAWAQARKEGATSYEARRQALQITGRAIILTSLLFCLGFIALLFSQLVLLIKFASFAILGLILAMFSALLFLPSLLAFFMGDD